MGGKMVIKSLRIVNDGGPRNYLNNQKFSHFVWNHYNPNNKWRKGMVVHHKDGDTLGENFLRSIKENCRKLTKEKNTQRKQKEKYQNH
jgi:hypothetical protein